jgi:F-type H+-transporting ATPase subunit a
VSTDEPQTSAPAVAAPARRRLPMWRTIVVAVVLLDIVAFFVTPPYPPGQPGQPVGGISDLIGANFEFPAPHVVLDLAPNDPVPAGQIVFFHLSITNTILTMWILMILIIGGAFLLTRGLALVPRGVQNAIEFVYEALSDFAISLGGAPARAYVPLFAGVFIFILLSNWSGLLPFMGKVEELRAPTSDVNITIGLALLSFLIFEGEGIRRLGLRGYFGKFFSLRAFRTEGMGAGIIALYVGFIEFLLEFIKPITLAMRLFGNIFGGELAIGVITALTVALVPTLLLGLELLLNFVQALIFSVLTLMYTLIAIESHDEEEHAAPAFANDPEGNLGPPLSGLAGTAAAH